MAIGLIPPHEPFLSIEILQRDKPRQSNWQHHFSLVVGTPQLNTAYAQWKLHDVKVELVLILIYEEKL